MRQASTVKVGAKCAKQSRFYSENLAALFCTSQVFTREFPSATALAIAKVPFELVRLYELAFLRSNVRTDTTTTNKTTSP